MLALLREISLRYLRRSRLRSLLVVIGIALGVALYTATEAASASMLASYGEFVARVSGRADLTIEGGGSGVPGELLADVASMSGVEHAAASIELTAQAPELGTSLLILGVDFLGDQHFLPFRVREGERRVVEDPLAFVNDPGALLISRRFAEEHGLAQGSRLRLLTSDGPADFHVRGVLEDTGPAASFGGQLAVMFLDAAQVSFARGTFVDRIDIALAAGVDRASARARLAALAGPRLTVQAPAQIGTRLRQLALPLEAALWTSGFLALLVGGFLVYNAVGVAVAQRRREVGLLRALGVTRSGTTRLFCLEAALLALPGVALGLALGALLSRITIASTLEALDRLYMSVPQVVPNLSALLVIQAIFAGLIMAVLAAYWPARRGARLDPAIVLRGSASVEPTPPPVRSMLLGALLVAALLLLLPAFRGGKAGGAWMLALLVLCAVLATPAAVIALRAVLVPIVERLLGVPGRLGLDYVARTLGRSSVNVLALMVAVSLSVSVGGWLGSFEASIARWASEVAIADLTVTQGSPVLDRRHVPFSPEASARIAALPGVKAVQNFRTVEQSIDGVQLRLVATDIDVFVREAGRSGKGWQFVEGRPLAPGDSLREPSLILSENAARLLRKHAGDWIDLATPRGLQRLPVRGVIVDYTSESGAAFLEREHFLRYFGDAAVSGISVYLEPAVDEARVSQAIRAAAGSGEAGGAVFVTRTRAVEQHIVGSLRETFSYSRGVELMTLLIALMGVVGTMAAAVLDRQREVSMLRAIGATRRQVALSIVVEAGFLGFCAAVSGVVLGLLQCRAFLDTLLSAQTGWHLEFVFPWAAALRTGTLVVATSALAGALPAWRAARVALTGLQVNE